MNSLDHQPNNQPLKKNRYCGRDFSLEEMTHIRSLIALKPPHNRHQLSKMVCEQLNWRRHDGRIKDVSFRVAMLRMHRDDLIELPSPERKNGNGNTRPKISVIIIWDISRCRVLSYVILFLVDLVSWQFWVLEHQLGV